MISRRQKMVNLWKQVRFIEIVDPGNQFVKNLMFDGVYSSDFALLSEDILDWFSAINERYASVYSDTEHHRAVKATIDQIASKKTFAPPKRCPLAPPFIYRSHAAWYERKRMDRTRPGPFFRKKTACIIDTSGFWLHTAAATASAPARAASAQGFGRHWPDRAHLERLRPVFQVCGRKQPFGVFTSAIGARRTGFIGADHVFKLARAGRAIKIVHRHKGITPF